MSRNTFNKEHASEVVINDGCIKSIWLEHSVKTKLDGYDQIDLETGSWAMIEFCNGKSMIITNSEWSSLQYSVLK